MLRFNTAKVIARAKSEALITGVLPGWGLRLRPALPEIVLQISCAVRVLVAFPIVFQGVTSSGLFSPYTKICIWTELKQTLVVAASSTPVLNATKAGTVRISLAQFSMDFHQR